MAEDRDQTRRDFSARLMEATRHGFGGEVRGLQEPYDHRWKNAWMRQAAAGERPPGWVEEDDAPEAHVEINSAIRSAAGRAVEEG